jgi:hypothetical protein
MQTLFPGQHSNVRSEPLEDGKRKERQPPGASGWAIAVALLVFGTISWIVGAKYTLDGWIIGLNWLLAWLGLPLVVPAVTGWFVASCVLVGLVYSRVEMAIWQARYRRIGVFWVAWLLIAFTDVISTFLGVRNVTQESTQLAQQVAASAPVSFVWALVLTFAPEYLMMGGKKLLKR